MTLNIDYQGQAFPWAAFYPKLKVQHKPIATTAQQVPNPFTYDSGKGIEAYPANSWLVFAADGSVTVVLGADFQMNWDIVST